MAVSGADQPMTDGEAEAWLNRNYFHNHRELRQPNRASLSTMAAAAAIGNIPMLDWLHGKGVGDLINTYKQGERAPLIHAIVAGREPAAIWLLEHGADPCSPREQALHHSCRHMSVGFVAALCDKIECLDLNQPLLNGCIEGSVPLATLPALRGGGFAHSTPLRLAQSNPDPQPVLQLLILKGARVRCSVEDWPTCFERRQRRLVAWLEHEVGIADAFLALLACGVHDTTQRHGTTKSTTVAVVTTMTIYTWSEEDGPGTWSARVVQREPRTVVTANPATPHQRDVNYWPKLRGHRNAAARISIAAFVGVREALELRRLREAHRALVNFLRVP